MSFKVLDTAVLRKDLPAFALKKGDVGAIVEVYRRGGFEVEFVRGSGMTQALVTLTKKDLRPMGDDDLLAVRPLRRPRPRRSSSRKKPRR